MNHPGLLAQLRVCMNSIKKPDHQIGFYVRAFDKAVASFLIISLSCLVIVANLNHLQTQVVEVN
jgi:hypothetical protein